MIMLKLLKNVAKYRIENNFNLKITLRVNIKFVCSIVHHALVPYIIIIFSWTKLFSI